MISIEQLMGMLEAQEELNTKYSGEGWRTSCLMGEAKFALLDEVGELIQELKTSWKWWDAGYQIRPIDRRAAAYELIDVIHFALLIALYNHPDIESMVPLVGEGDMHWPDTPDPMNQFSKAIQRFLQAVDIQSETNIVKGLFNIIECGAILLQLSTDDLVDAYYNKNALNHERVEGGVMEGRYDKTTERELEL